MIRVASVPEPEDFDATVRQPGLRAIRELTGQPVKRRGPKRTKNIVTHPEDIKAFPPYWTRALDHLLTAYRRVCAYACLYIHPVTGARSVDHMVAKSQQWDRVYEWTNYRLACQLVNASKGVASQVLDPFEVDDSWFALEFVGYQVRPGPGADGPLRSRVDETIAKLDLNSLEHREARRAYHEIYKEGQITLAYLMTRAPFVARELQRQGLLRAPDVSPS